MNRDSAKTIVLADDHMMFRQGMTALLESNGYRVIGEAADGLEAVEMVERLQPDLAVLDFGMPLMNGIDAAREIHTCSPTTRVLLLTMMEEDENVLEALRAGVRGYILKSQASVDLLTAATAILRGSVYLSPGISEAVVDAYKYKRMESRKVLSSRELQMLQLIVEGNTTKEAALILSVSPKTAESHRARIKQKLDIHEIAGLVRYAIRKGIVTVDWGGPPIVAAPSIVVGSSHCCWEGPCGSDPCGSGPCGSGPCGSDPCGSDPCGSDP